MAAPQVAALPQGGEDWKAALRLPPKDTRVKTEVGGRAGPVGAS